MIDTALVLTTFVTMLVIIDPIGLAPLFVSITQGMSAPERRAIALRCCAVGASILLVFALFGDAVLSFAGISLPAFRIAGGILLFLTALEMLFERRTQRRKGQSHAANDPSVFPLATPLIAGPGSITTVILLAGQTEGDTTALVIVLAVTMLVVAVVCASFLMAGFIAKLLGETGINVLTRLLGMLLAALSVQFVIDGIRASFGI